MKNAQIILKKTNVTAINLGNLNELEEYSFIHQEKEIKGKIFIKNLIKSTGNEISFSVLPPQNESPFFHIHNQNEEIYIFFKGEGYFQVDEDYFEVQEGSVVRVSPCGKRGIINPFNNPLIYVVIQSKANSLDTCEGNDSKLIECTPLWKKN